ncbi:Hypp8481 [Branchiostoma lanceolatum]|uniref:Hypp8481 protein n=1 Tax=Branchiostoma lanceolatum TaxID=7740 RepID=A0A8J9Z889_BRALA|nr:Hypp8481 [Branchiostoma lanceolatum]
MATAMTQPSDYAHAAATPSEATTESDVRPGCKPLFFLEREVHEVSQNEPYFSNVEVYKAISRVLDGSKIRGIQQVRGMWRIYLSETADRANLLITGFNLRNKHVDMRDVHPFRQNDGVRITVKDVPLSVDDSAIAEGLRRYGAKLLGPLRRERLRVDGRLTNCETGDRFGFMQEPATPADHIPRNVELAGRWRARVFYRDQTTDRNCSKCLGKGHVMRNCTSDWRCSQCNKLGHKRVDCNKEDVSDNIQAQGVEETGIVSTSEDHSCENAGTEPEQSDRTSAKQRQITDFTVVNRKKKKGKDQKTGSQQSARVTRSVVRNTRQHGPQERQKGATGAPDQPSRQIQGPDPRVKELIEAGRYSWSSPPGSEATGSSTSSSEDDA